MLSESLPVPSLPAFQFFLAHLPQLFGNRVRFISRGITCGELEYRCSSGLRCKEILDPVVSPQASRKQRPLAIFDFKRSLTDPLLVYRCLWLPPSSSHDLAALPNDRALAESHAYNVLPPLLNPSSSFPSQHPIRW